MNIIEVNDLKKDFFMKEMRIEILKSINIKIEEGAVVSIMGESGSGKTTLLNVLAGLMHPTSGNIYICDRLINSMDENEMCNFRKKKLGFVFQSFNLIPHLSALDNVAYPLIYSKIKKSERLIKAREILTRVGLADRINHRPSELSGGQKQRVSIARALINNPKIILADEPTGNLDSKNSKDILRLIKEINHNFNTTFIIVTHSNEISSYMDRVINIKDGMIV